MAVIKQQSRPRNSGALQLLVGIVVGAMGMHLLFQGEGDDTTTILLSSSSASSSLSALNDHGANSAKITDSVGTSSVPRDFSSSSSRSYPSSPGWHPIHVFFGDRNGLGAPDTQPWFAQVHQDEIIVDLLGKDGYFIDLAANDAKDLTNTLALERDHGWNGLCIEPNPGYWYGLSHRKCTVVAALVGGTTPARVQVKFRGVYGGIVGKLDDKMANRKQEPDAPLDDRYTVPMRHVLQEFGVPRTIDYMSLDVEGSELDVMKDFPFDEYTIRIMTIERPSNDLKTLLESNGYIKLKRLAWWGETLWAHKSTGFTPEHPKIAKIKTEERN